MDPITAWIVAAAVSPWAVAMVFVCCAADGIFPPVPGEFALVSVVAVCWTTGSPLLVAVLLAAASGAALGDNIAYLVGRRASGGPGFRWMDRPAIAALRARVDTSLERRPTSVLLTARFIPVARVLVNFAAGAHQLPYRRYLPISAAGAALWTGYSALMAILAGAFLRSQPLLAALIAVVIACAAGYLVDRIVSARQRARRRISLS
jgi:membrane protein DedA with SNARE-associated domain